MKKIASTVVAATFALTAASTLSPAVAAESTASVSSAAGCATKSDYKKVKNGMTIKKVAKILGSKGKKVELPGDGVEGRSYRVCGSKTGGIGVVFNDGKVVQKAAKW